MAEGFSVLAYDSGFGSCVVTCDDGKVFMLKNLLRTEVLSKGVMVLFSLCPFILYTLLSLSHVEAIGNGLDEKESFLLIVISP